MKVILTQDVKNLGNEGDIVDVSDGYARNYLIPRGLVVEATEGNLKKREAQASRQQRRKDREQTKAQALHDRINGKSITITARAGEGDKLFGAVTGKEIADTLNKQFKVKVDKKKVDLGEPIKHLGKHPVKIKIYPQIQAEITVQVEAAD
ncbi:MAG TPA: 50S ribosomal protein L9 [Gelria sp.]|jgi:large subunit ribosomal protein L9|nr:50S ribosomal protein L9 [Gelria sp.]